MMDWLRRVRNYWSSGSRTGYVMVAPAILVLLIFNIIPLFASFGISMLDVNVLFNNPKFVGIENYLEAFRTPRFWNSLKNTFIFTFLEVPCQMVIGLALAAVLTRNKWVNKLFRSIYFLPIICSATAVGIMWQLILNSNIGYVSWLLRSIGLPKISFLKDPEIAMYTVIFMSVWRSFGISTIIFVAGMQEVPAELYESADLDGASKFREFFSITLPGIIPTIYFVLITRLIGSMQVFDLIFVTTGGGPNFRTETMVNYIYSRAFSSDTRLGYATAMSECLFAIILIISILFYRRMLKDEQA